MTPTQLDSVFLAAIAGLAGIAVNFIRKMSDNLQNLSISVHELNSKVGHVSDTLKDHEQRLRVVEKPKSVRRGE